MCPVKDALSNLVVRDKCSVNFMFLVVSLVKFL